jgi:hypothetical protein
MILCVNGRAVGGMTEFGVRLELETSGEQLLLLVSRYKFSLAVHHREVKAEKRDLELLDRDLNDDRLMDWVELGEGKTVAVDGGDDVPGQTSSLGVSAALARLGPTGPNRRNLGPTVMLAPSESSADESESSPLTPARVAKENPSNRLDSGVTNPKSPMRPPAEADSVSSQSTVGWDGNAWQGCVCGQIHDPPTKVFWIQCDVCESWYNVAKECVAFDIDEAKTLDKWVCWGCPSSQSITDGEARQSDSRGDDSMTTPITGPTNVKTSAPCHATKLSFPSPAGTVVRAARENMGMNALLKIGAGITGGLDEKESGQYLPSQKETPSSSKKSKTTGLYDIIVLGLNSKAIDVPKYSVGDLVSVAEHSWASVNNASGIGRITSTEVNDEGDRVYDIKNVVGGTYRNVLAEFVRPHVFF